MGELLRKFGEHVDRAGLLGKKDRLVIAVSGGVDSMVLCELCRQAGFSFSIAHCNFQLRREESKRDEEFVREWAKKYNAPFFLKKFDTEKYAAENKFSIQEAARNLRYGWFNELITANSDESLLLTAHHADDNMETILMNFFRGTGLTGLTGIPPKAGYIRRPLLPFTKKEILDYALENKLSFVEDSSNASNKYSRNFIRLEIIPRLTTIYPQVSQNLAETIQRFTGIAQLHHHAVGELKKKLLKKKENEIHVPIKQLMGFNNKALIYEVISEYGFTEKQIDEVIKLAVADNGSYISSPGKGYHIIRNRHWFIITPADTKTSKNIIIESGMKQLSFDLGKIRFEESSNLQPLTSRYAASLDKKQVSFPLVLRKWKTGDYFYPLGMRKKKKISRFLIDQKLSKTEKDKAWVIESNKKIIWVVGHRIDDRFKITAKTKQVYQIELLPAE
jgi:tRNA(Ile)-lysidine synthase